MTLFKSATPVQKQAAGDALQQYQENGKVDATTFDTLSENQQSEIETIIGMTKADITGAAEAAQAPVETSCKRTPAETQANKKLQFGIFGGKDAGVQATIALELQKPNFKPLSGNEISISERFFATFASKRADFVVCHQIFQFCKPPEVNK